MRKKWTTQSFLQLTDEKKRQVLEEAYFKLGDLSGLVIDNPLKPKTKFDTDNPHLHLIKLLRNPDYFGITCKWLFNIDLLPMQMAVLKEMWTHKFPMLIASRGGSKCITGDSFIQTEDSFVRIGDLSNKDFSSMERQNHEINMFGENGYNKSDYMWNNGFGDTIKLETSDGFHLEGTNNHPIRIVRDGNIIWCNLEDLRLNDYVIISRDEEWLQKTNDISPDIGYLFGVLVGDGGYTIRGKIVITAATDEIIKYCNPTVERLFGKTLKKCNSNKYAYNLYGVKIWDDLFQKYGFNSSVCAEKDFPKCILSASRQTVASFIRGLMDTDGTVSNTRKRVGFCSKSENLVKTLQFLLTKFGIISRIKKRLNKTYNRYYWYLSMNGENVNIFQDKIGFKLKYKSKRLNKVCKLTINSNKDVIPRELIYNHICNIGEKAEYCNKQNFTYKSLKMVLDRRKVQFGETKSWKFLENILNKHYYYDKIQYLENGYNETFDVHIPNDHSFITNGIISHNSYLLALFALLKALFCQGSKIVIVGAGFRQSKIIFNYMEDFWKHSPILQDMVGNGKQQGPKRDIDKCSFYIGDSVVHAIPIGVGGAKIRGLRATLTIADEFAAISEEVFETVIGGFSAVNLNPVDLVKRQAQIELLKELNLWDDSMNHDDEITNFGNQTIISGTAYYEFNHFAKYHQRWHNIIQYSKNQEKIAELFDGKVPPSFKPEHYSIIRLPYSILPKGMMDDSTVARAKATIHSSTYSMEFECIFCKDSNGFYKRTLIESCVCNEESRFNAVVKGNPNGSYVYAIDPASERDNFALIILEKHADHSRIVYCWTINKKRFKERVARGLADGEHVFYGYCARKIRDLMKVFPTEHIGIDTQGGGGAVSEHLQDPKSLQPGEQVLLPYTKQTNDGFWWEKENKPTDGFPGLHILHMIDFAKGDWVSEANHGMKKDFEDKKLLFPYFDPFTIYEALSEDKDKGIKEEDYRLYDTLEDCVMEIEELKEELTLIQHSQTTGSGRERWDTPEIVEGTGKKGRLKKDRYSALLMANMISRVLTRVIPQQVYDGVGGFLGKNYRDVSLPNQMYVGNDKYIHKMNNSGMGAGVIRTR